ncbi:MAG: AMP-binding protein [Acidobacteria bacterium]|nr:AMP-binding protein [Acidobacteriota bacterium]
MTRDAGTVPATERQPRETLAALQGERLARLLAHIHGRNPFYTRKLTDAGIDPAQLVLPRDLAALPFTTKAELVADQAQAPPWGTVLTEPLERYTRYNQTSSTTGRPLRWIDTAESWQWMLDCWQAVYRGAGVGARDRIFFPFSFGPFLGFWTAFDAATQLGAHAIPAGGMTSRQRLALIESLAPTVVCCTPTYALRLLDVAREKDGGDALAGSAVRTIIVAGEPGGSIPATRSRIERGWGARIIDHHGLTEVGPISFECREAPGYLHVNEREYIAEVLDPQSGQPLADGSRGELVITNLGRTASPLIRYRTGDLVVATNASCACGRTYVRLVGGILARADDMVSIRGANVYPTAVEEVLRAIDAVVEYRCTVMTGASMRELAVEVEVDRGADEAAVTVQAAQRLREALGLNVQVTPVAAGSLPRFEMKARRFVVDRSS